MSHRTTAAGRRDDDRTPAPSSAIRSKTQPTSTRSAAAPPLPTEAAALRADVETLREKAAARRTAARVAGAAARAVVKASDDALAGLPEMSGGLFAPAVFSNAPAIDLLRIGYGDTEADVTSDILRGVEDDISLLSQALWTSDGLEKDTASSLLYRSEYRIHVARELHRRQMGALGLALQAAATALEACAAEVTT